ncbi:MAG: GNAT family N-acetyltransferase [Gammaproteobacteria bacterium]|nr:GNAT family N-acetyltransferase [Gammaproteobacteria bacterium]
MNYDQYQISVLDKRHNKKAFSSGVSVLDRYLAERASQETRRNVSITYVLSERGSEIIAGYYTLSSNVIMLDELPVDIKSKLPYYPTLPTTLLGRLAVDKKYLGNQLGEKLLIDALKRSYVASQTVASMAVIVKAKDKSAINFYKRYDFTEYHDTSDKLFLPMKTIEKVFVAASV